MKRKPIALLMGIAVLLTGCGVQPSASQPESAVSVQDSSAVSPEPGETEAPQLLAPSEAAAQTQETVTVDVANVRYLARPSLLTAHYNERTVADKGTHTYQKQESGLSNVYMGSFYLNDEIKSLLDRNGFALTEQYDSEFFEMYEGNRYDLRANYVTVDSMMHTYHLYFAYLLKRLEKEQLSGDMLGVSRIMLSNAAEQYEKLKGTEWENAARIEMAYFAVGCSLLDPDAVVPDAVAPEVQAELKAISEASGIEYSNIFTENMEDYSQYIPRGYYDGSEDLKRYFKAMMWYGRMGFSFDSEDLSRASVLVTLGMEGDAFQTWAKVYDVTSFFAGASDDLGYYEIRPTIEAVYGAVSDPSELVGKDAQWNSFKALCKDLPAPAINSIPVYEDTSDEERDAVQKGFRFMGQRFSIDESSFTQLTYRQVKENADGGKRMLPDALDFPAALGSDTALAIVENAGKANYPNYKEQLEKVRRTAKEAPAETWTANLYSAWIYTLMPLLETKDSSYPTFMQSDAWRRKELLTFEGSYTELKHDTILYSKQMMGEMGGYDIDDADDRGYVEAEPEVFARLQALVEATSEGLSGYGMLADADRENLRILAELSGKLCAIAEKELAGELPTDEEFELIRTIGGQLEHFWQEVMKAEFPEEQYHSTAEHPAPIVADIATDPNGTCLEVGTGKPMEMYVVVEVDGQLKVASGPVYSFYQFEQPISDRLTDSKWRTMLGYEVNEEGRYEQDTKVQYPDWYHDLMYDWRTAN
ncbi:MAG: DUF3160 domain-containing protein [Oscillospiraceae bacterium]|nr:DUF3160 domain-containing protein [Oscillospiraceae bacterium]